MKGLMLVLVVDQGQMESPWQSIARVCRDYDCETLEELVEDVRLAAEQAGNQLRLGQAIVDVLARARG